MKTKRFSKVLAFLVAVVMIFSALPLMAFAADEATTYTVSFGAPAIPMNVNTKVDLKTLNVEMVKGEAAVSGADITWAADAQEGLTLDVAKKTVGVTKVGNYKLTATANSVTKNVWVVVKAADDEQFVIYSETFGDYTNITTFPSNWKSQWRQDGQYGTPAIYTWTDFVSPRIYGASSSLHQGTASPGIVPFSNTRSWNSAGYFTLNDEVVSAFSDYTVIATMAAYAHHNSAACGAGIFGRANTTSDGKLDNLSTLTGVYAASHNSKKLAQKIESAPGADATKATITRTELGGDWDYTNRNSRTANVTMVAKFDGENLSTYMKGDDQTFTATTTNTNNGTVGIYAGMIGDANVSSEVNIREFKVVLNNTADDMPAAGNLNSPTPDPEPDPDPTPGTKPSKPNIPQTGDNTNPALWVALLFVSGLGIFAITLFGRNKREEN